MGSEEYSLNLDLIIEILLPAGQRNMKVQFWDSCEYLPSSFAALW
jgi:hypothetical protein